MVFKTLFFFCIIVLIFDWHKIDAKSCIECICQVESQCKPLACHPDPVDPACGYFQIHRDYYSDCGTPGRGSGEDFDTAWKRCSDEYGCASLCVQNYVNRYSKKCNVDDECEKMARLHNGGPNGCDTDSTLQYWYRVKKCMGVEIMTPPTPRPFQVRAAH